jgi:hypothetical protein
MIGGNLSACTSARQSEASNNPRVPAFKIVDIEDKNKAVLYIYRPYRFGSALAAPAIYINNHKIVVLRNQHHIWLSLNPGKYVIETRLNSDWAYGDQYTYQLMAESGQSYFLRVRAETTFNPILFPPMGTDFPLIAVKDSEALTELGDTQYLEPERKRLP